MKPQDATLTFLHLIEQHQNEWGWYQFERAFPPGWFCDESPGTRAKDILDRMEREGLVTLAPGEHHSRYRLTERGADQLRKAALEATAGIP